MNLLIRKILSKMTYLLPYFKIRLPQARILELFPSLLVESGRASKLGRGELRNWYY